MKQDEVFEAIVASVKKVAPQNADKVTKDTELVKDEILDSLDLMSFLFEFEEALGTKLDVIDEEFSDFRVSRLIDIAVQETK